MSHDSSQAGPPPGRGEDAPADADSWVAQWSKLFDHPHSRSRPDEVVDPGAKSGAADGDDGSTPSEAGPSGPGPDASTVSADPPPPGPPAGRRRSESRDVAAIEAWQKAQERTKRRAKVRANQRKARSMQRHLPDSNIDVAVAQPEAAPPGGRYGSGAGRGRLLAVGGLLVTAALVGYLLTGSGIGGDDTAAEAEPEVPVEMPDDFDLAVGADVAPRGIEELALSTVQLVGLDDERVAQCAGSGVIVGADGTILTNAHVVTSGDGCRFTSIGVGVTVNSGSPPELEYVAEVAKLDLALDLAVLRISGPLDPSSDVPWPRAFPPAPLGDSDTVELGDVVRVLGYPVIGGDTITLTTGSVSGFTSQVGVGNRALIKTDATISAGNSGGLAIDPEGRVIGIPTKARASESGPAIDCRPLSDTNDDGAIDEGDNCVPVGGFLNGVRPINLALPVLRAAGTADTIGPFIDADDLTPEFDQNLVVLANPRFSRGRIGNDPADEIVTAPAGISELCFFVDWQGIPTGTDWDGVWYYNGELQPDMGYTGQKWIYKQDGRNFWQCAKERSAQGLPAGIYEFGFFLDRELQFVEAIELTPRPVEVVPIAWLNSTEGEICSLAVNPKAESGQVGLDEMPGDVTIPPGGQWTMDLPLGTVVVEAFNCADVPVADHFAGLEVEKPDTFVIGL